MQANVTTSKSSRDNSHKYYIGQHHHRWLRPRNPSSPDAAIHSRVSQYHGRTDHHRARWVYWFIHLATWVLTMVGHSNKVKKSAQSRLITTLDSYMAGDMSLYATVLTAAKPRLAPDPFSLQSFITQASRRFQPYAWLQYDSQLWLKLAANLLLVLYRSRAHSHMAFG